QPGANHVMIVRFPPGVTSNMPPHACGFAAPFDSSRGATWVVIQPQHHDAADAGEHVPRVRISLLAALHICHLARVASIKPVEELADPYRSSRGANTDQLKSERVRLGLDAGGQRGLL